MVGADAIVRKLRRFRHGLVAYISSSDSCIAVATAMTCARCGAPSSVPAAKIAAALASWGDRYTRAFARGAQTTWLPWAWRLHADYDDQHHQREQRGPQHRAGSAHDRPRSVL